jgi:hypothetical protein
LAACPAVPIAVTATFPTASAVFSSTFFLTIIS